MLFVTVFLASLIIGSFFGHLVHLIIHQPWSGPAFRGHMSHHLELYPPGDLVSDRYRTAKWQNSGVFLFTPPFILILGAVGGLLWWLGAPLWVTVTFGMTMLAFSLANDFIHDASHIRKHPLRRFRWFKRLCVMHYIHHHDMTKNYGIVNFTYDRIFGTFCTHT